MITFAFTLAFTLALILVFRRITINYAVEFIAASLEAFSAIVANFAGIKVAAIAFTTVIANFSVIKNTFFHSTPQFQSVNTFVPQPFLSSREVKTLITASRP